MSIAYGLNHLIFGHKTYNKKKHHFIVMLCSLPLLILTIYRIADRLV
jgi:hypothetical protein